MKKQLINLAPIKESVKEKLLEKYNNTIFMNTDVVDIKIDIKEILEQHIAAKNLTEPSIYITADAYIKMRKLVNDTSTEIGWYGTVTKQPGLDEVYIIDDIIVYPQRVTGVTCEQDDDKMFNFEMSLTTDQVNHKRFQGHSHVNMGVTPSGVDEQFYRDLLTQVNDYFIITITNKREEYTTRFYDIANNIVYSGLPIKVLTENGSVLDAWYENAKTQLVNRNAISSTLGSTTKTYTAADKAKQLQKYSYRYDYDYDEDPMIWDKRFGYIRESEKDWYDYTIDKEIPTNKPKGKRGRPKKER
jgi:hypothetical protein